MTRAQELLLLLTEPTTASQLSELVTMDASHVRHNIARLRKQGCVVAESIVTTKGGCHATRWIATGKPYVPDYHPVQPPHVQPRTSCGSGVTAGPAFARGFRW